MFYCNTHIPTESYVGGNTNTSMNVFIFLPDFSVPSEVISCVLLEVLTRKCVYSSRRLFVYIFRFKISKVR